MVEKLFICLVSGFLCPILLEFSREVIKRRRDRLQKISEQPAETTAPALAPGTEPPSPPVTEAPPPAVFAPPAVLPPLAAGSINLAAAPPHPAGAAGRTRNWPWIVISIMSGVVLGPILGLLICSTGQFCRDGFFAILTFSVSIVVCAVAVRLLLKLALLPVQGTGVSRMTRIGLRIIVSALIGSTLGAVITLILAIITSQKDLSIPWFVVSVIICTMTMWLGLNRRGPLRRRT